MLFSAELKTPPNFSTERFEPEKIVLQILLSGKLDLYNSTELFLFTKVIVAGGLNKVILDMKDLEYVDSSGIGVIIKSAKLLRSKKGEIAMMNVPDSIMKVFKLIKLERLITMFNTEADAISYLRIK